MHPQRTPWTPRLTRHPMPDSMSFQRRASTRARAPVLRAAVATRAVCRLVQEAYRVRSVALPHPRTAYRTSVRPSPDRRAYALRTPTALRRRRFRPAARSFARARRDTYALQEPSSERSPGRPARNVHECGISLAVTCRRASIHRGVSCGLRPFAILRGGRH